MSIRPLQPIQRQPSDWLRYEALKREWSARNKDATPEQYTQAMRTITKRLGI